MGQSIVRCQALGRIEDQEFRHKITEARHQPFLRLWVGIRRRILEDLVQHVAYGLSDLLVLLHGQDVPNASDGCGIVQKELAFGVEVLRMELAFRGQPLRKCARHLQHLPHHRVVGLPREEDFATAELEKGDTNTPEVDLRIIPDAQNHLWGPVVAWLQVGRLHCLAHVHSRAEITKLDLRLAQSYEHVVGFQVTVNQLHFSETPQRQKQLPGILHDRLQGKTFPLSVLGQRRA
mmetsp:Transcript_13138/g.31266  ORF Transcript_13138/g.31266 Transcript_13138/m.31266 type:complete len:234 (-) Transcript_13138:890-1591(-)